MGEPNEGEKEESGDKHADKNPAVSEQKRKVSGTTKANEEVELTEVGLWQVYIGLGEYLIVVISQ